MELCAITDEISQDFEHALDVMVEYGVRNAELRCLWDVNIGDLSDEQIGGAKKALHDRGFRVSCLASPFFKCDLWGAQGATGRTHGARERGLDEQMALLAKCIRLCEVFDTTLIRVFSFWRQGELSGDVEGRVIEAFQEPAAKAEEAGVILGLENEHACYLGTGEQTARVVKAVDSPSLQAVWDPGNAFYAGEVPYPDGYQAIRPYICHVHVKDAVWDNGKLRFVRMGDGEIDYVGHFRALRDDGYSGVLSLETHYKPESGTGEDGSRECLASLNEMLAAL